VVAKDPLYFSNLCDIHQKGPLDDFDDVPVIGHAGTSTKQIAVVYHFGGLLQPDES
jgi:hypothetical protein